MANGRQIRFSTTAGGGFGQQQGDPNRIPSGFGSAGAGGQGGYPGYGGGWQMSQGQPYGMSAYGLASVTDVRVRAPGQVQDFRVENWVQIPGQWWGWGMQAPQAAYQRQSDQWPTQVAAMQQIQRWGGRGMPGFNAYVQRRAQLQAQSEADQRARLQAWQQQLGGFPSQDGGRFGNQPQGGPAMGS